MPIIRSTIGGGIMPAGTKCCAAACCGMLQPLVPACQSMTLFVADTFGKKTATPPSPEGVTKSPDRRAPFWYSTPRRVREAHASPPPLGVQFSTHHGDHRYWQQGEKRKGNSHYLKCRGKISDGKDYQARCVVTGWDASPSQVPGRLSHYCIWMCVVCLSFVVGMPGGYLVSFSAGILQGGKYHACGGGGLSGSKGGGVNVHQNCGVIVTHQRG